MHESECVLRGWTGERSNVIRIELCNLFHGLEGRKEVCRLHDIGVSKGALVSKVFLTYERREAKSGGTGNLRARPRV